MADILNTVSVIFFIAAGVFAVLAIALWFLFKIPIVIGDLSGRTAKKSIERMRLNNEKTGNKSYKTSKSNLERGKLTGTMEGMKQSDEANAETGLLNEIWQEILMIRQQKFWLRMKQCYWMETPKLLR